MEIDKALRVAMAERHLKQWELAEKADIHKQTVSNICSGGQVPTLNIIISICSAMDMKVSELMALGED